MSILISILISVASVAHADSPAVIQIRTNFDRCSNEWAQVTRQLFLCTLTAAKQMEEVLDARYRQTLMSLPRAAAERFTVRQSEWESSRDQTCEYVKLFDDGRADYGIVRRMRCRYHAALRRVQQLETN